MILMKNLWMASGHYLRLCVFGGVTLLLQYQILLAPDGVRLLSQLFHLKNSQEMLVNQLIEDNKNLRKHHALLQNDQQDLEYHARTEWRLVLPKDKIFRIEDISG